MIADECRCPGCGACASHKQRTHLLAEVERLRAALEFYADKNRYKTTTVHMCGHATGQAVMLDRGKRAREALKKD